MNIRLFYSLIAIKMNKKFEKSSLISHSLNSPCQNIGTNVGN